MEEKIKRCKTITILIVADEIFRVRIIESLKICSQKFDNKFEFSYLFCEHVSEIQKMDHPIAADFVVFIINTESRICVKNVEYNLQLMSKEFICGRTCIVNGNAHIPLIKMGVSLNDINALIHKYSCTLLNADIMDSTSCLHLANRILILIISSLGLNQTPPFLPWLIS